MCIMMDNIFKKSGKESTLKDSLVKINYQVIRSKRKTISISLSEEAGVVVRVPERMRNSDVEAVVEQKRPWIIKHLQEMEHRRAEKIDRIYETGTPFLFQGKTIFLNLIYKETPPHPANVQGKVKETPPHSRKNVSITLEADQIMVITENTESGYLKTSITKWYKMMAKQIIIPRALRIARMMNENIDTIRIKDQKSRWGSCSSKRNLNFNWKLVMAPEPVLDYVIIHELCHLKHMNHSKAFWEYVEQIMPDYQISRKWLKENGHKLQL